MRAISVIQKWDKKKENIVTWAVTMFTVKYKTGQYRWYPYHVLYAVDFYMRTRIKDRPMPNPPEWSKAVEIAKEKATTLGVPYIPGLHSRKPAEQDLTPTEMLTLATKNIL